MLTNLWDATRDTCGGKASALAALAREGLPVPDGFVVPFAAHRAMTADPEQRMPAGLREALARELWRMGDPPVAVRSSAAGEDTADASAAGQYESVIAVRGPDAVTEAVRTCWASASSARVARYRLQTGGGSAAAEPDMAVLVQRLVDADVSGVMFTPSRPGGSARIEASWGLGLAVVGGTVAPDAYEVAPDGGIRRAIGRKTTRLDRDRSRSGVVAHEVPEGQRALSALGDGTVGRLSAVGGRAATILGGAQDVEWAIEDGRVWLLQSRPVTAPLPPMAAHGPTAHGAAMRGTAAQAGLLTGAPGARGLVAGSARLVRGPSDFDRVRAGDILVCPHTDPAWTPLFAVAAGVVTETGGALSHAAIVAREYGIPAVLGVARATTRLRDDERIIVDGAAGTITRS